MAATLLETNFWRNRVEKNPIKFVFFLGSIWPLVSTLIILLGGLLHFHVLVVLALLTIALFMFVGPLCWLPLSIFLVITKRITFFEFVFGGLMVAIGIAAAYFVIEYDIFSSGAKYID
jgi:hypothetical protein